MALPPFPLLSITGHKHKTHEEREGPRCPNDEMFPKGTRGNRGIRTDFSSLVYDSALNSGSFRKTPYCNVAAMESYAKSEIAAGLVMREYIIPFMRKNSEKDCMRFEGDLDSVDELTGSHLIEDRKALLLEMCRCGGRIALGDVFPADTLETTCRNIRGA